MVLILDSPSFELKAGGTCCFSLVDFLVDGVTVVLLLDMLISVNFVFRKLLPQFLELRIVLF